MIHVATTQSKKSSPIPMRFCVDNDFCRKGNSNATKAMINPV